MKKRTKPIQPDDGFLVTVKNRPPQFVSCKQAALSHAEAAKLSVDDVAARLQPFVRGTIVGDVEWDAEFVYADRIMNPLTNNTKNVLVGTAAVSAIIVALYALTH